MRCTDALYIRTRLMLSHSCHFLFDGRHAPSRLYRSGGYVLLSQPILLLLLSRPLSLSIPHLISHSCNIFNPMLCIYSYCEYRTTRRNFFSLLLYQSNPFLPFFSFFLQQKEWRYVFSISLLSFIFSYLNVTTNQILYNP